jgi:hypothetical protein
MDDEKMMKLIEGAAESIKARTDTQWDRDARAFTARLIRDASVVAEAQEAARLGAAAADALEDVRQQKIKQREKN